MIKSSTIQAVRGLPIQDVIGRYITALKKKGSNYVCLSPFSEEKTPSFTIFPRNNNFKCFSSGNQGDAISFVMLFNKLEFYEAIREIASDHRIPIEEEDLTPEQKETRQKAYDEHKEIMKVMEFAKHYFLNNEVPQDWSKDRKFKKDLLQTFQVGYGGSGNTGLYDDAIKAGFSEELLKKAGLFRFYANPDQLNSTDKKVWIKLDSFRNRVVFPILDVKGNCLAFTGRTTELVTSDNPKYFNSPDSVWEKSNNLYGIYQAQDAIRKADKAYLVEGPTDVIAMHRCDITNTVSPCGSSLTDGQCKLLRRYTDNVCIVPDNDQGKEKEKGKNPGMEALERNAIKLLSHGFYVSVLIPGDITKKGDAPKDTDPDTFLRKMIQRSKLAEWLDKEQRYIEDYLTAVCLVKAAQGAKQATEAVKTMEATVDAVKDYDLQGAYYDSIAVHWPLFKKQVPRPKRKTKADSEEIQKLQKENRDSFFEDNFWIENGSYWTLEKKKKEISNFTFEALFCVFHLDGKEFDLKYVLRLISKHGRKRLHVISSDNFCVSDAFKKSVHKKHGYFWYGNQTLLDSIKDKVVFGIPEARELERVGWNKKNNFWVWSNGLYYDGQFHPIDRYGISTHARRISNIEQFKKIPSESQVKIENTLYVINTVEEFFRERVSEDEVQIHIDRGDVFWMKFFYLPYGTAFQLNAGEEDSGNPFKENSKYIAQDTDTADRWGFARWCKSIRDIYPGNGELIIAYYVATVYSDIIYNANFGYFPLLFMFGKRQSGKSTAARSIMNMFGKPPMEDGINLASGSTSTGMQRSMDSTTNHPFWGNEYKNNIHKNTIEALKGIADRSGKLTGMKTGGNETRIAKPRGSGIISGQDLPTQDPALLSRCLVQEYDDHKRADYSKYLEFKQVEDSGIFTTITCELVNYRQYILENYHKIEPEISSELLQEVNIKYGEVDRRSILNMSSILAAIKILMDHTKLKFPFTYDELKLACIESIKLTLSIQHQSDEVEQYFHVLQSLANLRKIEENVHFRIKIDSDCTKLYLRAGNIHGLYKQQAKLEGITALDQAVLGQYLRKHHTFIQYKKKNLEFGPKQRTCGFIFNYDKLLEQGIELQNFKSDNGNYTNETDEEDLKVILSRILDNMEREKPFKTDDLKLKFMNKYKRFISDEDFIKLIDEFNKTYEDSFEIIANDDNMKEIYIKNSLPF